MMKKSYCEKKEIKFTGRIEKNLPEQEYNVLVKIILEDKKYKEVAEELHISINTVKTHLSRALKMLRRFNMTEILILFNL